MSTTENLGLTIYNDASGSEITFLTWRLAQAGISSNMEILDTFGGETSASISALQSNSFTNVDFSVVSSNYYEATVASINGYLTNLLIVSSFSQTNSGAVTVNINDLGIKAVKKVNAEGNNAALSSGDLKLNQYYLFKYDGTEFVLLGSVTADQISVSGTVGNFLKISASGLIVDSGVAVVSGATAGSYNKVDVNTYGQVTAGCVVAYLTAISGSSVMSSTTGSEVRHNASGVTTGSYNKVQVDSFGHVTAGSQLGYLTAISGSSVMSNTTGSEVRHNYSGVTAGSYTKVQVDAFGHITSASEVTGMSGTISFYSASATGGAVTQLNTVVISSGLITSWTQA